MNELDILRKKIDKIDRLIINLLSRRFSLVSKIGQIKSKNSLLIYTPERELMMLADRRENAMKLGISSNFIEDIFNRIIRESYSNENKQGFKMLCPNKPCLVVIIGGSGQMGQFFHKMFMLSGYLVQILEKHDWNNAKNILLNASVVLISVPIHVISDVLQKLPVLPDNCILVDISSIKNIPLQMMLQVHAGPVLGLHPMFHPEVNNMVKQIVICCHGRYPEKYNWLLEQIQIWGARLYYTDALNHDKNMSLIQSLCHFTSFVYGMYLFVENINLKEIDSMSSPVFRLKLIMIGRLFIQDPSLYADIFMSSEFSLSAIKSYYYQFGKLITLLESGNKEGFLNLFRQIKFLFSEYSRYFLSESRSLLHQVNSIQR